MIEQDAVAHILEQHTYTGDTGDFPIDSDSSPIFLYIF